LIPEIPGTTFLHLLIFKIPTMIRLSTAPLSFTVLLLVSGLVGCSGRSLTTSPTPTPSASPQVSFVSPMATASPEKARAIQDLEQKLQVDVSKTAAVPVRSVKCPANINLETTKTFTCQATAEGKTFPLAINLENKKKGLRWSTKDLLVLPKLEKNIQQGIQEQFGLAVKTNCGGKIRLAKRGETFACKVTDPKGQTLTVNVRVDDEKGNVTWKL
jgi:hypothetical protein